MSRIESIKRSIRLVSHVFSEARVLLLKNNINKPAATILAYGARGTFQSITRQAAKHELKIFFGVDLEFIEHKFTKDTLNFFMDSIIEVNLRAIQQFYNQYDSQSDKDAWAEHWMENNVAELQNSYLLAAGGYARSGLYDFLFKQYMNTHGVEKNVQIIIKEYGFAMLDVAFSTINTHTKKWLSTENGSN